MSEPIYSAPAVIIAHFGAGRVTHWRAIDNPRGNGAVTTRGTVFRIASMSKSFLAATALALRDEGKLDFERSIDEYVPGVRFVLGTREYPVTTAQLLSNCSGMPEDNAWGDRQLGATRERISDLGSAGFRLTARPGERYQYSNVGMSLVGRAIERVVGHSVEEEVQRRFLVPLALHHTRYRAEELPSDSPLAPGLRSFDDGHTFLEEPVAGTGALACIGGLWSTVDDIARWAWFLSSAWDEEPSVDSASRDELLLSAQSRREMQLQHTPIPIGSQTPPRELDALGYGLGLVAELDRGLGAISSHSGGLPGFSSHMRWHRATGTGVVVFGNSDLFTAARLAIAELAELLSGPDTSSGQGEPWPETLAAATRFDAVLRAGDPFADLTDLVAENFFMDVPAEVRDRRLRDVRGELGPLCSRAPFEERILASDDAAHLRWRIDGEQGAIECEMRMIGLHAPLVQSLSLTHRATDPHPRVLEHEGTQ